MKQEDLTALGLQEEQAKNVLALHEKELGKAFSAREGLKAENDTLKSQLEQRDADIEALKKTAGDTEALTAKLTELQGKYQADTEKLQEQLSARDYNDAIRSAIESKGVKFSSKAAERAFMADLREKQLKLDNGALMGFDDFLTAQKTADPSAFMDQGAIPHFSQGSHQGGGTQITREGFLKLPYAEQYKFKQESPELFNAMMKG